jgi:glucose-6-phosphate-specific signal transduction histidine kinase
MNIQLWQLIQVQKNISKRTNAVGDASEASSSSSEINLRLYHGLRKFRHAVRRVNRLRKSRLDDNGKAHTVHISSGPR